jgi:predicted transcriptional regulator
MTVTLEIRLGSADHGDLEAGPNTLDAGESIEPRPAVVTVESLETLGRVVRPTNLELLGAILDHEPSSIRELARSVDRHAPEVLDDVHELADYGLLELESEGRATRPVVWYDELDVSIPLDEEGPRRDVAAT